MNKKNKINTVLSFVIPVIGMCLIYAASGIYPFGGDRTLLTNDMNFEYVNFFSYIREVLLGKHSLFYTFSKVIGGDMAGFFGYYLLSPFNLLVVFFDTIHMAEFALLVTLLKTGTCGLTMYLYLHHKKGFRDALLFSSAYALMAYNVANQQNIMWMDAVWLLPFIVWGMDQILEEKRFTMYTMFLGFALVTNYYTGYMICLFSVLYFMVSLIATQKKMKLLFRFFIGSLLAGGIAACVLIPIAFSLSGGKAKFGGSALLDFVPLHSLEELFRSFFVGTFELQNGMFKLPNIYCSIVAVILVFTFFVEKSISNSMKTKGGILLFVMCCSVMFSNFERIWHGTELPTGYPHRNSFLISFLLVLLAGIAWDAILVKEELKYKIRSLCIMAGCFILFFTFTAIKSEMKYSILWINVIFLTITILFLFLSVIRQQNVWKFCLFFAVVSELIINGAITFRHFQYTTQEGFQESISAALPYVKAVQQKDSGFYRMELSGLGYSMNNPMLFGYRGLSSSSSGEEISTKVLSGNLGLNEKTTWVAYHDQMSVAMESFLGLKYVIANGKEKPFYQKVLQEGEVVVYENPYALPIGVLTDERIHQINIEERDMFLIQKQIWDSIIRSDQSALVPAESEEIYREDDGVSYIFTVTRKDRIYTSFFSEGAVETCDVTVNGKLVNSFEPEKQSYCLGSFQVGDRVQVDIRSEDTNIDWYDLYFYYEDIQVLKEYIEDKSVNSFNVEEFSDVYIKGKIQNEDLETGYALFTIPYDLGWSIYLDGKEVQAEKALNSLICLKVPKGEHEIILKFIPPGLFVGICITLISFVIIKLYLYRKRSKKV